MNTRSPAIAPQNPFRKLRDFFPRYTATLAMVGIALLIMPSQSAAIGSPLDGFDPDANIPVHSLAMQSDGKILVGGEFTSIGGVTRNRIARFNADGSLDTSFDPNASSGIVHSLALQADGKILVGGSFTVIGGVARSRIARLHADGSLDTSFNPNANNEVASLAVQSDGRILLGGNFTTIGGVTRNRIARLHADGSLDTSFTDPDANSTVFSLASQSDGKILVGGGFTTIGGVARNRIARLNADGSLDDNFVDPNVNNTVLFLALQADGGILLAGDFTTLGGVTRNKIARLNVDGSLDTSFNPNANSRVSSLAVQSDGKILVGGGFTTIGGVTRNRIARLNTNGTLDPSFNPNANSNVYSLAVQADGKILLGGVFFNIGGVTRNRIARLHADGSNDADLNPNANNEVLSLALQSDGKILVGGYFTAIGGVTRNSIARLNADGSLDTGFNPDADNYVYPVAVQEDGKILLGGGFTAIGGVTRNRIARLNADGSLDTSFNPDANGTVRSLAVQADGKILVGGGFITIGGVTRNRIARLNADGSLDTSFDPNLSIQSVVHSLALQSDGKILVGGAFNTVGGVTRNNIARLNADGSLDTTFNPNANDDVYSMALQSDGKILLGGVFATIGGVTRNYIARLNADGSLDTSFDPNAGNGVVSLAVQSDGKILLGGWFTTIGGVTRNYIARLNADGSLDPDLDPNAGNTVNSLALQADGKILVGGFFTAIGGVTRNRIARLSNTAAFQNLSASEDGSNLAWTRGGSSPEVDQVSFEQSIDDGATWTFLGQGSRIGITSDWEVTGLSLPLDQNLLIRATGQQLSNSALYGGSGSSYESVRQVFLPSVPPILINEVDVLTQSSDTREFIELYDGGDGNTALDGLVLVLFDGATDTSYHSIDLDGESTDANGYFVIGNSAVPNVDLLIADGTLQDGADAVALYTGNAVDFPNGTAVTTDDLIDALVYDSGQVDDTGLLVLLNASEPQLDEAENGNAAGHSLQRLPNGDGGARSTSGFSVLSPTPGVANTATPVPGTPDLTTGSDSGDSTADDMTKDTTPTFTGTARAGALVSVSSSVTGGIIGTGVADTSGNWSATAGSALADGAHQITATADGSAASPALTVTIDTAAPGAPTVLDLLAASDSGTSDSDNITSDNTPTIDGQADTGTTVTLNSSLDGDVGGGTANSPWSITASVLQEGVHEMTAITRDAAGNDSAASAALELTIDTGAPTVTINQAAGQADPASGGPVLFTVVFSEAVGGFGNGDIVTGGTAAGAATVSDGPSTFSVSIAITASEGLITAAINAGAATDAAGNNSLAATSSDNRVVLDVHGSTPGEATALSFTGDQGTATGWLEPGDSDFFSFTVTTAKFVEIQTTGPVDTIGSLRNSGGTLLNDPNVGDDLGSNENFLINQPLPAGTYTVEVGSKGATQSGAYQLEVTLGAMVSFQPDNEVGRSAASTIGDGVYGTAAGQTLNLISKKARTVRGVATIGNDGEIPDDFVVRGTRGNGLFKVIYTSPAGNVTAAVVSGTYQTGELDPGAPAHAITVTVKPNKKKIVKKVRRQGRRKTIVKKKRITLIVTSVSEADGTSTDSGFIKVKTK